MILHKKTVFIALVALIAFLAGGLLASRPDRAALHFRSPTPAAASLSFYTSPSVTTPQLPFWAASRAGKFDGLFDLKVEYWKDPESLQSLLLAGKGDLWIGHMEGFARASSRGAPVTVLAVTGWRKFYLLSKSPAIQRLEDVAGPLPFTPPGSPSVPLLKALLGDKAGRLQFVPHEPKQLSLLMLNGQVETALVPEPIVSTLLERVPGLRIAASLEHNYCQQAGCSDRVPLAGIAANTATARRYPQLMNAIISAMQQSARQIDADPAGAAAVLPEDFAAFVPRELVEKSLQRDIVLVEPAALVEDEIKRYLSIVAPELGREGTAAPAPEFIWRPQPGAATMP